MVVRAGAAVAAAACLAFCASACGSGSGADRASGDPSGPGTRSGESGVRSGAGAADCDPNSQLSQAEWIAKCGTGGAAGGAKGMRFGKSARTIGADGAGELRVTPTTVVDATAATGEAPDNDQFTIVAVKDQAAGDTPAAEADPEAGNNGGWKWITKSGRSIEDGEGNSAFNVVPDGFEDGGVLRPGARDWRVAVFDLTDEQREDGTLMYVDGAGTAHRWAVPERDTGPQLARLRKETIP